MSDSDVDSSSLPPPPPPLPHSNSPKAQGSKTKGSPFEGAIQLPIRPASTTSGRSQVPLTQPSNNSSPVPLSRSSQWNPSSEPSTPPITDAFDPIYGRRRRRCKRWLVGSLTTIAVVIAVVFGLYVVGQRRIFLKHVQEHQHHNETSTTGNESLVKNPDLEREDIQITHTPQPTETLNEEGVPDNILNENTPASTKNESTSTGSVLLTHNASTDLGTQGKVDLSNNNVPGQTETSIPEEVPEKPSDEDNLVIPPSGPNAGTEPIRKTSKLPSSKLQGDLMEALMEGNHKTVNQLKRASPHHELTQEEIALLARGEPLPDVNAHSSEEDEEYSEEEQPSEPLEPQPAGDFIQQPTENTKEEETEAQEHPVGSAVENPGYDVLQPSSRDVKEVQIPGNKEAQPQTNHLQYPTSQESAEQPIESQELPVEPQTNHLQYPTSQESAEQPIESQELPVEPQTNHLPYPSSQESAEQPIESQEHPVEPQTNHLPYPSSQESAEQPIESQEHPVEPQTNHLPYPSSQESAEQPIESQEHPVKPQINHLPYPSSQESTEQPIESQEHPVEPQINHLPYPSSQESAEQPIESQEHPVEPQINHLPYPSSQESTEQPIDSQELHVEPQTNQFQDPSSQESAEQPIESQDLPVKYSPEEVVEQEHNFGGNPEQPEGFFPAEHELSFEGKLEEPSGAPEYPAEFIPQERIEQGHPFGNFREQEVGTQEHGVGHIPSEHRLPFENTQENSFGVQEHPAGSFPEQSPETREYTAFGQPSEEKDFPSGYSSEQAFENEEHTESIQEQPAELHEYQVGKTYRQSDEIEDSIHGSPEALAPASQYPDGGVQPGHMGGNSPIIAPVPHSSEYSLTRQTDGVEGSKEDYLEKQTSSFVRDNYQPNDAFGENAVPSTGEIFTNEIDSPIMTVNRLHFPEQDFAQPPVFVDPYYNPYVPQDSSPLISNEFDPYRNDVLEPSTVERFDELPAEPVDALHAYLQGGDTSLPDEERLQTPDEPILQKMDEGHLLSELAPDVYVPHLFEGPLLVDDSQEFSGSHMASGEMSHEELEEEGADRNQEVPDGAPDKLAFSEGPSVFNEGTQINQYPETRSVPVLAGKLNGEFAGSLDEDDELRTAGLRRSIGSESPYSPLQPRVLSKFSLREGPPVLLPHNGLPNKIPTAVPSSLLLPEGTIATPAVILEALPAILQQSGKQAGLSSPVSSNPIQIGPGSAQKPPERLSIPLTNLPNQVAPETLSGVHPSGQLIQLPYPFNNSPSILANNIVPYPENTPHGASYLRNANLPVPNQNLPLHTVPFPLNPPANPWYHLLRSGQPSTLLPPYGNLPYELSPLENLPDELPPHKNLPDELPCNENLPDELSHPQTRPLQPPHPPNSPRQTLIPHQPLNPTHPLQQLLHAEKVPYHLINPHHRNPHLVGPSKFLPNISHQGLPSGGPSKHNAHSRPLRPPQTMRNLHSRVIPKNHPNVRHIPESNFTPSEREKAQERVPHPARNPPWLQSITLPPTVDTSVLKTLQQLDNLNALNHATGVTDSDALHPSDESSIKYPPLNAHLHGEKHAPLLTPQTSPEAKPLALTPSDSNYGIHHADESSVKHPPLRAFPHSENHKPLLTPQTPHQQKSFAPSPIVTNSERLYPVDKNNVKYPLPQALWHGKKHSPFLLPQNLHHSKTLAPAPIVTPAELPHPTDKSPIIHPSTNNFLHGNKHKPVFLPQTSHKINTLPLATHSETPCSKDKSSVKHPPLNAFLHDEKHPSPSSPQTPHTFIEPLPSKSIVSSPVAVEAVSPVDMFHPRAHLNHLPHPPFKNFGMKPLAFNEAQQPPSSPLAVYEAKQASRLPLAGYAGKQPLPFHLPIYDTNQPSPLPLPPYDPKQLSSLPLDTYDTNQPPPASLSAYDTKQPSPSPWHIYYAKQSPPSPLPVYDEKQPTPLPLIMHGANQPPPSSLPVYETKQPTPSSWHIYYGRQPPFSLLPPYDVKQLPSLPLTTYEANQPPASSLPVYDTKQPSSSPWHIYYAKQPTPFPLPVYDAKQASPLSLAFYGAKQAPPVPFPVYDAPQPFAVHGANQYSPFSASSQYTPLVMPDDENVPKPASVDHLARPDVAALLKSNDQLGLERLAALSEPEGILSPCSGEGSSEEPLKPSIMLVSSQPIDKITTPVHPNGKPALPVEYLPGPYAWKDKNIVYSSNFPDLPIPAAMSNGPPTESTDPSLPLATPFGPSSILSHFVESVPFTWVQPISRVSN